jgi:hypothetical protein
LAAKLINGYKLITHTTARREDPSMGKHSHPEGTERDRVREFDASGGYVGQHRDECTREDAKWEGGPVGDRRGPDEGWQIGGR